MRGKDGLVGNAGQGQDARLRLVVVQLFGLLVSIQERLEDLARCLGLTLQCSQFDLGAAQGVGVALQFAERGPDGADALLSEIPLVLQAGNKALCFLDHLLAPLAELGPHGDHRGMLVSQGGEQLRLLLAQPHLFQPQANR